MAIDRWATADELARKVAALESELARAKEDARQAQKRADMLEASTRQAWKVTFGAPREGS